MNNISTTFNASLDESILLKGLHQHGIPHPSNEGTFESMPSAQAKTQSGLNNMDKTFALKNLNIRSEIIVNRVVSQLAKRGKLRDGQLWVKIPAEYFAKALKLTKRATFHHIKKLKEEKLLISQQFDKSKGDLTNYYTINIDVMTSDKFRGFFAPPIVKKLHASYIGFISPYRAYNKSHTSQNKSGAVVGSTVVSAKRKGDASPTAVQAPAPNINRDTVLEAVVLASPLPKSTTVQDMHRIWQEETGREDKLNKRLARFMVACYQKVFKTLSRWREYVKSLCKSTYITENMFSKEYFLKWVLSFKVIQRILDGGFGVLTESGTTESGTNQSSANQKEERMSKGSRIAQDILSDSVMQMYKRYENDQEARELIAKFIECYGKYEAVTVFSNACINLKGNILRLYFNGQFWLDRFNAHSRYDKFIRYCQKTYDFKFCESEA